MLRKCFGIAASIAMIAASSAAQAPVPMKEGFETKGFAGWEKLTSGLPNGMRYLHKPSDGSNRGIAVWMFRHPSGDTLEAFKASAAAGGIDNVRILATHKMTKAKLLDSDGWGTAIIADGQRRGKTYRMAALVVYGSLDESPKTSGVHMFVAPEADYAKMGGWTVPASRWLYLDPVTEVADVSSQGSAPPAQQAQRLAGTADIWAQFVLETYIQMAQSNIRAMSNFRKSVVCAGDPNCIIVPVN